MADPPATGEIVIATPERIEAIMRNPDFDSWISSFGVVCVDEAHLISDEKRGPVLECVITRFLSEKAPPRFVFLSATLGNCDALQAWLKPCDVVHSSIRRPPLQQEVWALEDGEKTDDKVITSLERVLAEPGTSALVFVYRTDDAARLATKISATLGNHQAAAYHSKMPAAQKSEIKDAYINEKTRCLVSTTALGAGVNLPATHVIVRDLTFGQDGLLPIRDLLQMMGRAGRGTRNGRATAILKPSDAWKEDELSEQIRNPSLPDVQSVLIRDVQGGDARDNQIAKLVLGQLARRDNQTVDELKVFFDCSLGGKGIAEKVDSAVRWLCDGQQYLAWPVDSGIVTTALGKAISRTGIPLEVGAGFGVLIRDVLMCDPEEKVIKNWTPLDTLLILELLNPRERSLKRFSKELAEQVEDWFERSAIKSVLFTEWIRGTAGASKAEEVLGSLGVKLDGRRGMAEAARQYAYVAAMRAIVMYQLGNGMRAEDVSRRWTIKGLDGVQERWRDHLLWQLAGIAEILDIRCFYNFLRKECDADDWRVTKVKGCFKGMLHGVYDLMGLLRFCSPLGPLFRDLETAKAGVGVRTKEKLESIGIASLADIANFTVEDLRKVGIRKDLAKKLKEYIRRRTL